MGGGSAGAESRNQGAQGTNQNGNIQPSGHVPDIVDVTLEFFRSRFNIRSVAVSDLRPAGNPGPDDLAETVKRYLCLEIPHEIDLLRPRAHQTHVSQQNVANLRQLVQPPFAQYLAHAGNAWVGMISKPRTIRLGLQMHAAEFQHPEDLAAAPHALLNEKHRPGSIRLDGQRNDH